jgi:hypothetical protein
MPSHLKRYQTGGDNHFITFSCYQRSPSSTATTPEPSSNKS